MYKQLVKVHQEYKEHGFEVLAFPCNQFMNQEPGTNAQIKTHTMKKYGTTFPLFAKCEVNGANCHEVFRYLRFHSELYDEKKKTVKEIPWNFSKFIIDSEGKVRYYSSPREEVVKTVPKIEELLGMR